VKNYKHQERAGGCIAEQLVFKTEVGLSQSHKANKGYANDFNRTAILSEQSLPFLKEYEDRNW